jgi:hypothetical protein
MSRVSRSDSISSFDSFVGTCVEFITSCSSPNGTTEASSRAHHQAQRSLPVFNPYNQAASMSVAFPGFAQPTVICEGYLYKQGAVIPTWKQRYFVLRGRSLCYFKSLDDARQDGRKAPGGPKTATASLGEMQLDEVIKWDGRNGVRNGVMFVGVDRNSGGRQRIMKTYANDSVEASKWGKAGQSLVMGVVGEAAATAAAENKAAKPVEVSKFELMKADFRYERYFRMVELGVPVVAVCTRMVQNNTARDAVAVFADGHDCTEWNMLSKKSSNKKKKNMIWEPLDVKNEAPTVWSTTTPVVETYQDRGSRMSMMIGDRGNIYIYIYNIHIVGEYVEGVDCR